MWINNFIEYQAELGQVSLFNPPAQHRHNAMPDKQSLSGPKLPNPGPESIYFERTYYVDINSINRREAPSL